MLKSVNSKLLVAFLFLISVASAAISPNIIGNPVAKSKYEDAPWIVSLHMDEDDYAYCVATLINVFNKTDSDDMCQGWIVTAASCNEGLPVPTTSIVGKIGNQQPVDNSTSNENLRVLQILSITTHENHNPLTFENDIALFKVEFENKNKSCLEFPTLSVTKLTGVGDGYAVNETMYPLINVTTAGWGLRIEDGPLQKQLFNVSIPIQTDKDCATLLGSDFFKPNCMLCAGFLADAQQDGSGPCSYDTGAPLVCQYTTQEDPSTSYIYLCGIASMSSGCGRKGSPTVFTDVVKLETYGDWITNNTVNTKP